MRHQRPMKETQSRGEGGRAREGRARGEWSYALRRQCSEMAVVDDVDDVDVVDAVVHLLW